MGRAGLTEILMVAVVAALALGAFRLVGGSRWLRSLVRRKRPTPSASSVGDESGGPP